MDLTDFRLLVGILDSGSVTRGAERAFLSLPAASNRVKHLEAELNVTLLTRGSRGVAPTPAGLAFGRHARTILKQLESLRHEVGEFAAGGKGCVRVHGSTAFINSFLPDILSDYLAVNPGVSVDTRERLNVDVVRDLQAGDADIGLVCGPVYQEDLQSHFLFDDPIVLVVPAGHEWSTRHSMPFEESLETPHVSLHEGSTLARFVKAQAEAAGRAQVTRVSVASYEIMCRMIEAGLGVGIMPRSTLRRYGCVERLCEIGLLDGWAARTRELLVSASNLPDYVDSLLRDISREATRWAPRPLV